MKTALVLTSACFAISSTASADTYLGVALGSQPGINDAFVQAVGQPSGRSLRGLVGMRFGRLSLEGALNGFSVFTSRFGEQTAYQASGALKLNLPLGNNFEAFARGGIERTWLNQSSDGFDLSGTGYLVGGGFEYRLDAMIANASIFVDYNIHHAGLDAARFSVDATEQIWGLGILVGL
ncbi:MAG TPA: outer membrane beta-barrel protein [Kofleriaceae bacterium]